MFCDIVGQTDEVSLPDFAASMNSERQAEQASGAADITKYLTSMYLNPGINGPRLDLRKIRSS
jgi:hypothetical protein